MWRLPDPARLAAMWRSSTPFPHLVIDGVVGDASALLTILDEEHVDRYESDLFAFEATAPDPTGSGAKTAAFRSLRDNFAAALCPVLTRVSGKAVTRADMRAYAYRPGH